MVRRSGVILTIIVAGVWLGVVQAAQSPAPAAEAPMRPTARNDLRHQIYVMEGALQRAVQFGAQLVNRQFRSVSPEMMTLAGDAQARGVYLDGYGVFFDVGVPILRQSMTWMMRTMFDQDDSSIRLALELLRRQLSVERDPAKKHTIENAIRRFELQLGPLAAGPVGQSPRPGPAVPVGQEGGGAMLTTPDKITGLSNAPALPQSPLSAAPLSVPDRALLQDPNRAYTDAVQNALVEAMIDYAAPMQLGPDEWLTVGARDNEPRDTFAPQDPYEQIVTVLLRIKGSDLADYRAGRIDRDEAKKRVQIREF